MRAHAQKLHVRPETKLILNLYFPQVVFQLLVLHHPMIPILPLSPSLRLPVYLRLSVTLSSCLSPYFPQVVFQLPVLHHLMIPILPLSPSLCLSYCVIPAGGVPAAHPQGQQGHHTSPTRPLRQVERERGERETERERECVCVCV